MMYQGRATFVEVKFRAGPRFLGQNLSKIQTMGVEFGADLRSWGHFLENVHFKIKF